MHKETLHMQKNILHQHLEALHMQKNILHQHLEILHMQKKHLQHPIAERLSENLRNDE